MRTLKYLLIDAVKHKARVHHLDFIGAFLQTRVKNRIFVKLDSRYADYFPEYSIYFVIDLILLKSIYGMTNSGKLFSGELTEWLLESGFIQYKFQISIYFNYAPDGTNMFLVYYVDDCVYWYISESLGKWSLYTLGNIFHVNFLGYAHWFMSISISQMKDHSISVDQSRYATSIVTEYLDNVTVNTSTNFYKNTFPYDMIFTKSDTSASDEKVEKLTREFNIHYRACIWIIYLFVIY